MTTLKQQEAERKFKPSEKQLKGQKAKIVNFIELWGSITPAQSWTYCNCSKLATRIGEIERRCGHEFKHEMREGIDSRFMEYSFADGLKAEDYMTKRS